jgi:hypothetical protein
LISKEGAALTAPQCMKHYPSTLRRYNHRNTRCHLNKELNADEILELILRLPTSANREQVCDLIVNVIMAYGMKEDFPIMALIVTQILEQIDDHEGMTIH